jgi:hypothetical protein
MNRRIRRTARCLICLNQSSYLQLPTIQLPTNMAAAPCTLWKTGHRGADFALHARPEKTAAGVAACPPPLSTPSQYAAMTASRPLAVLRRWSARTSRDSQACRDRSGQQNPSRASRSRARPRAVLPANLQGDCGASACAITRSSPHPCTRLIGLVLRFCSQTSRPSFAFTLIQGHEPVSWQPVRRCRREEAARHSLSRH